MNSLLGQPGVVLERKLWWSGLGPEVFNVTAELADGVSWLAQRKQQTTHLIQDEPGRCLHLQTVGVVDAQL